MTEVKPLNWQPTPGVGYTVVRRTDGGMHYTFTDLSEKTVRHWHEFAQEHLLNADRLTRNLYDLRQLADVPEHAVRAAIDANSDPAARNIRAAVVVKNEAVAGSIRQIAALALAEASAAIRVFTGMEEAEAWLARPLDKMA
jgi:hypothetical protein